MRENNKIGDLKGKDIKVLRKLPPTIYLRLLPTARNLMLIVIIVKGFLIITSIGWVNGNGIEIKNWKLAFNKVGLKR